ncbi:MAG: carboxymuconolactone decarboxylase family protein [Microthrixaceae bacterium]
MPHIALPDAPGILGPMMFRPETAEPLNGLAEVLLRGDSTLTRGERETIAAYVSHLNGCNFCHNSHATFAALQLDGGWDVVDAVMADPASAPVSPKLRALLAVAALVQRGGTYVTTESVEAARAEGATDVEIHDTVLIAAAFCMFNRYVDGLGTIALPTRADYEPMGHQIVQEGYAASTPPLPA